MNPRASWPLIILTLTLVLGHGTPHALAQTGGGVFHNATATTDVTPSNALAASAPKLPNDGMSPKIPGLPDNGTDPNLPDGTAIIWGTLGGILAVLIVIFFLVKKKQ